MKTLQEKLIRDEGIRYKMYYDSEGIPTIGVGRNLTITMSHDEVLLLLRNDIKRVREQANQFTWFNELNKVRQHVVLNMIFNLGITRFKKFKKTIQHLDNQDYKAASKEMLNSKWARQVKGRAIRLSKEMATGKEA